MFIKFLKKENFARKLLDRILELELSFLGFQINACEKKK